MAKMMHHKRSWYQHPLMGGVETLRGWLMATFPIHLPRLEGPAGILLSFELLFFEGLHCPRSNHI